jgi:hypothetical protein
MTTTSNLPTKTKGPFWRRRRRRYGDWSSTTRCRGDLRRQGSRGCRRLGVNTLLLKGRVCDALSACEKFTEFRASRAEAAFEPLVDLLLVWELEA